MKCGTCKLSFDYQWTQGRSHTEKIEATLYFLEPCPASLGTKNVKLTRGPIEEMITVTTGGTGGKPVDAIKNGKPQKEKLTNEQKAEKLKWKDCKHVMK